MKDFDKECGFWLYQRPYVWLKGSAKETSRRLYLLHENDMIHIYTRKGYPSDNFPPFSMEDRRIRLSSYNFFPAQNKEESYSKINVLDLWANEKRIKHCDWASRYFGVYIEQRDGKLKNLDVRRNGVPFKPKGIAQTTESYLKRAGFLSGKGTNFIKLPDWMPGKTLN